jgi:serine/threonine protein kinase
MNFFRPKESNMERPFSAVDRFISMGPKVFLEQYRISTVADDTPIEMARNGPAITYKASDLKSGAPVALTRIPTASVDPAERERFEEKARTAMVLDHVNIAKTVAFGTTDDSLVFVSEYPQGETVEAWVKVHGPMPPDAVLRVALQVVAALGAASFHGLTHPAIKPANLVIVRGKTAEGGWPLVKLTHFALSGLKSAPGHAEPDISASDFASPEQLLQGITDFRSEIYSLGATMCFLLTGVFYSAYPRSPQTKRFTRPLRTLISRTLEDDPNQRPQDPLLFTEEIRSCLASIERRQNLQSKYGIPFAPIVRKPRRSRRVRGHRPTPLLATIGPKDVAPVEPRARPSRLRPAWAIVGALLALGIIAALFLPEDVVTAALHRKKSVHSIGVPVGVPESSAPTVAQIGTTSPVPASNPTSSEVTASGSGGQLAQPETRPATSSSATAEVPPIASPAVVAQQTPSPNEPSINPSRSQSISENESRRESEPATAAINSPVSEPAAATMATSRETGATAPTATPAIVAANNTSTGSAPPSEAPDENASAPATQQSETNQGNPATSPESIDSPVDSRSQKPVVSPGSSISKLHTKKPEVVQSRNRSIKPHVPRALPAEPDSEPVHIGRFRARVVGVTPAGNVIVALPNGERAIVSPQDADQYSREPVHRRPRRVIIEQRTFPVPPVPPYQPFVPPDT